MADNGGQVLVRAYGQTDVGAVRDNNEDAYVVADLTEGRHAPVTSQVEFEAGEHGVLVAVSDGMGGAQAGEVASALVVDSLRDHLDEGSELEFERAIRLAAEAANRDVWKAAKDTGRLGMGATLTAVLIHGPRAHIAQVGDSRAYLIRNNRIRQVTKDQSYVEVLVTAGVMTREEAEKSPYKNVILQAMGAKEEVSVAVGRLELRRGDIFLVCSDGLWGKMKDEEILSAVREGKDFPAVCEHLISLAKERGGEDNITVVLAEAVGDALPEPHEGESVTRMLQDIKVVDPGK